MRESESRRSAEAFTLVELIVVIGIIAVLVSLLLPALSAVRRQANAVACATALREIGNAFNLYAHDEHGYWPMSTYQWIAPDGSSREKRWSHYISRYAVGVSLNEDGTNESAEANIKNKRNVLWGCPAWDRVAFSVSATSFQYDNASHNGYAMNHFPFAPVVDGSGPGLYSAKYANVTLRNLPYSTSSPSSNGWYYKAVQWKQPSERALVFDNLYKFLVLGGSWPWWTPTSAPMPAVPMYGSIAGFNTIDFNRHGTKPRGNKANDATINMLYCDGHVAVVSAREAFKAVRFK